METDRNSDFIVADTSAIVSMVNADDHNHRPAVHAAATLARANTPIIVPWDVFSETMNLLGKRVSHATALAVARHLAAPAFLVIDASDDAKRAALARFNAQPQSVSFTDCVVMAVADAYATTRIFGFDEAFTKNGYQIVKEVETPPA